MLNYDEEDLANVNLDLLDDVLEEAGVLYSQVVTTADEFAVGLRSGIYLNYVILGDEV